MPNWRPVAMKHQHRRRWEVACPVLVQGEATGSVCVRQACPRLPEMENVGNWWSAGEAAAAARGGETP